MVVAQIAMSPATKAPRWNLGFLPSKGDADDNADWHRRGDLHGLLCAFHSLSDHISNDGPHTRPLPPYSSLSEVVSNSRRRGFAPLVLKRDICSERLPATDAKDEVAIFRGHWKCEATLLALCACECGDDDVGLRHGILRNMCGHINAT